MKVFYMGADDSINQDQGKNKYEISNIEVDAIAPF